MTKVYITKYLFTNGIIGADVNIEIGHRGKVFYKPTDDLYDHGTLLNPGDYYMTEKEATDKAWEMQSKKIVSLKEQIRKIEDFETLIKNNIEVKND